jgi:hypothetical protein
VRSLKAHVQKIAQELAGKALNEDAMKLESLLAKLCRGVIKLAQLFGVFPTLSVSSVESRVVH